MTKNSSLIANLFAPYEYHSKFPIHIFIDCSASLSWTKILKGKRSDNGDQKGQLYRSASQRSRNYPLSAHHDTMQFNENSQCTRIVKKKKKLTQPTFGEVFSLKIAKFPAAHLNKFEWKFGKVLKKREKTVTLSELGVKNSLFTARHLWNYTDVSFKMMKWAPSFNGLPVDSKFSATNIVFIVHMGCGSPKALVKVSLKLSLLPSNGRSATRCLKKE